MFSAKNSFSCFQINGILKSYNLVRNYAFKSDLKIKWVRPEKIPFYKFEKTGDLEGLPVIDEKQLALKYRNSIGLQTADENVKKLFTLEFAPKQQRNTLYIRDFVSKVKRHKFDVASAEVKIGKWTGAIRTLQQVLEKYPHDKRLKVYLKEMIERRKKHLKFLRRWDYKKFEWLIENLNIVYKPEPTIIHQVTRKESLRKLTNKYCDDLKQERLNAYRSELEKEQPVFLEEKIRALSFIRDEQSDCGMNITISKEDIENVRKQLEELKKINVNKKCP